MKRTLIILTSILLSNLLLSQISVSDSIQISQDKTLKGICKEVNRIGDEIAKIDSSRFSKPQLTNISNDTTIVNVSNSIPTKDQKGFLDMLYRSFGNIFSGLLAAIISIGLFYRKWKNQKAKELTAFERRINEKNDYLKSIMKKVIELSEKYKQSIKNFTDSIANNPYKIPDIELYPLQEYNRLQKVIENEEYFHAFLKKYGNSQENVDKYRTIASLSDYLQSQTKEFLKTDYRFNDHSRKTMYSNLLGQCNEDVTELGMNNRTLLPQLNIGLQQILMNYGINRQGTDLEDLGIPHQHFVEPLTDFLLQDAFFVLPDARMLLNKLSRMRDLYLEIPMQNETTAKKFEMFQTTIEKVITKLKEEAEIIISSSSSNTTA